MRVRQVSARNPRGERVRGRQQRGDLFRAEHVRLPRLIAAVADVLGRDLRCRVQRVLVAGKDPHRVHPAGDQRIGDRDLDLRGRPLHRDVVADPINTAGLAERDEASQ
jgi:hypothetical protein